MARQKRKAKKDMANAQEASKEEHADKGGEMKCNCDC